MTDQHADTEWLGSGAYVTVLRADLVRVIRHADAFTSWGSGSWKARDRLMEAARNDGEARDAEG